MMAVWAVVGVRYLRRTSIGFRDGASGLEVTVAAQVGA